MKDNSNKIAMLSYSSGIGARNPDCGYGPMQIKNSHYLDKINNSLNWEQEFKPKQNTKGLAAINSISQLSQELSNAAHELAKRQQFFVTLGGDHSSAIGTWSGVAAAIAPQPLGLIWIDAHLDSHTMNTTPSGNIHGMPLAILLGYGDKRLTTILSNSPKVLPENVCVIGVRSFEQGEQELLEKLKVRIFYMNEVINRGLSAVFSEALDIVTQNTVAFGVSLDLDAIDPLQAPGVGTPEKNGIEVNSLYENYLKIIPDQRFIATEIVEFNPHLDIEHRTEKIIINLLQMLTSEKRV